MLISAPPVELPTMLLMDNSSFVISDPILGPRFPPDKVMVIDVGAEMAKAGGEFFGPVYRQEMRLVERLSKAEGGRQAGIGRRADPKLGRELALLRLRTVFSVPRNDK